MLNYNVIILLFVKRVISAWLVFERKENDGIWEAGHTIIIIITWSWFYVTKSAYNAYFFAVWYDDMAF